jgi:hypothetical protein
MSKEGCAFGYKCKFDHMKVICQGFNSKKGCKIGSRNCVLVHEFFSDIKKEKERLLKEKDKLLGKRIFFRISLDSDMKKKIKNSKNLLELFESKNII